MGAEVAPGNLGGVPAGQVINGVEPAATKRIVAGAALGRVDRVESFARFRAAPGEILVREAFMNGLFSRHGVAAVAFLAFLSPDVSVL